MDPPTGPHLGFPEISAPRERCRQKMMTNLAEIASEALIYNRSEAADDIDEGVDVDEKMDNDVENKLKTISPNGISNIEDELEDDQNIEKGQNKDSNANKNWTFNFNEDNILASSAGEEANNFLNNLIQRVEEE